MSTASGLSLAAACAAWVEFRRSSAFHDLLAECALWTAPWACYPTYEERDCAEEFAHCAAMWSGISYDHYSAGAQALPLDR